MTKRRKFILSSFILAVCLLVTQYIPVDFRFIGVAILFGISYAVSAWALSEDLKEDAKEFHEESVKPAIKKAKRVHGIVKKATHELKRQMKN